jgi:hypothetical protein
MWAVVKTFLVCWLVLLDEVSLLAVCGHAPSITETIGYIWSYLPCRIGHLVRILQLFNRILISLMVGHEKLECSKPWIFSVRRNPQVAASGPEY